MGFGSPSQSRSEEELEQVERSKREQERILELKRVKRAKKTVVTKTRHSLERLCASSEDVKLIENEIADLWAVLESCINVMDELQDAYSRSGELENKNSVTVEAEGLESEINNVIEKAEGVIKQLMKKSQTASNEQTVPQSVPHMTDQSPHSPVNNHSLSPQHLGNYSQRLKLLKVPIFDSEKSKFEDFWGLFLSPVDLGGEPANIKMARLRQSLTGSTLEAIRGLGVTQPEYEEAKQILKSKFGGECRKLQAYMDQIKKIIIIIIIVVIIIISNNGLLTESTGWLFLC